MENILANVIEEIIPPHASAKLRDEIASELASHIESELYELALRGISGEKARETILNSFGKTCMIQQQFARVHWWSAHEKQIKIFTYVMLGYFITQICIGFLLGSPFIFTFFAPIFTLIVPLYIIPLGLFSSTSVWPLGLIFSALTFIYIILSRGVFGHLPKNEQYSRVVFVLGSTITLLILSLFLSERSYVATDVLYQDIYAKGGFPIQAFSYSYAQNPTGSEWLRFLLDGIFWLMVSLLPGLLLPESFLKRLHLPYSALIVTILMVSNFLVYLFLRFD